MSTRADGEALLARLIALPQDRRLEALRGLTMPQRRELHDPAEHDHRVGGLRRREPQRDEGGL